MLGSFQNYTGMFSTSISGMSWMCSALISMLWWVWCCSWLRLCCGTIKTGCPRPFMCTCMCAHCGLLMWYQQHKSSDVLQNGTVSASWECLRPFWRSVSLTYFWPTFQGHLINFKMVQLVHSGNVSDEFEGQWSDLFLTYFSRSIGHSNVY